MRDVRKKMVEWWNDLSQDLRAGIIIFSSLASVVAFLVGVMIFATSDPSTDDRYHELPGRVVSWIDSNDLFRQGKFRVEIFDPKEQKTYYREADLNQVVVFKDASGDQRAVEVTSRDGRFRRLELHLHK